MSETASKIKVATVWLDGCSGCHMSFLDMDERLLELGSQFDLVYSPLVDFKVYPERVDVALVEGAISSVEDEHKIHHIRKHTNFLIAMGDCAVTGNVPPPNDTVTADVACTGCDPAAEPVVAAGLVCPNPTQ